MSTIQQLCPSCNRLLELPAGAGGRLGKCPACEATFTIQGAASAGEGGNENTDPNVSENAAPSEDRAAQQAAVAPYGAPLADAQAAPAIASPPTGASPFSAPLDSGTVSGSDAAGGPWNPYDLGHRVDPVASASELQIVPRQVEEVLMPTLSIFASRWGPLMLAFVVVLAATVAMVVVPAAILGAIADSGSRPVAALGVLIGIPLTFLFSCYVSVGLARNALAVARNSPSPLMELFPPLSLVVRFLVAATVMSLVAGLAVGLFAGFIGLLSSIGGEGLAGAAGAIGVLIGIALGMTAYWLLWSWVFIVSDGKATALGSIKAAFSLTMHNKMSAVLMIVIASALSIAGAVACYIGLLVTQPLTNLMLAVAYLLMTNQEIANPRVPHQPSFEPPPTEPTF